MGDTIVGGAGTDTLDLTLAGAANAAAAALPAGISISGVEIVNLIHTDNNWTAGALANSATFAGVQQLWQIDNSAGGGTFGGVTVAAGVTAGFKSTGVGGTAQAAAATVTAASGTQKTLAVALDGVLQGSNITVAGAGVETVSVSGTVVTPTGTPNALTLTGVANVETLNVGLNSNLTLTLAGYNGLETINFTGTGNVTADLTGAGAGGANLNKVIGGAGSERLTVDLGNNASDWVVDLGAGNDRLTLNVTTDTGNDKGKVTLGAGQDTLIVGSTVTNVVSATADDFLKNIVTVTDFSTAQDTLNLNGGRALTSDQLADIKAEATLFAAVSLAATIANGSNVVFSHGTDAYILVDGANAGTFGNGDGLIKLVGVDATQFSNVQDGNLVL